MAKYQLMAAYWDGQTMHKRLGILEFPEGTAPKGSLLLEGDQLPVEEETEEAKAIAAAKAANGPKPTAKLSNPQAKDV
jgi:hypothetical protein